MRSVLIIAAALMLVSAGPDTHAASERPEIIQSHETKVGEIIFLKLPGNPELGYKWRLNRELSKGLDHISVDPIGWLMAPKVQSLFFKKQSMMNVLVAGKSAGQADIAFDYYRRYVGRIFTRTSLVRVVIKP